MRGISFYLKFSAFGDDYINRRVAVFLGLICHLGYQKPAAFAAAVLQQLTRQVTANLIKAKVGNPTNQGNLVINADTGRSGKAYALGY